jgi:hypothetical protein
LSIVVLKYKSITMKRIKFLNFLCCVLVSVTSFAQVGVGTTSPNASVILEVSSTNKGVLLPSVNLTSNTMDLDGNSSTVQPVGMLVYNSGTVLTKGYCYWSGTEWRSLTNSSLAQGTLGAIQCNAVSINPESYTAGTAYSGTMSVPYTGSNGGVYSAQTIGPVNGLTATLVAGNFTLGSGTLLYAVTGTPTVTSPTTTTFPISIGGKTCSAVVGLGTGIAPGDLVYYKTSISASVGGNVLLSTLVNNLPVIGGKLRLDMMLASSSNVSTGNYNVNPVISNITNSPIKFWFSAMSTVNNYNASNYLLASGSYVYLDDGIYCNYGFNDILGTSAPRVAGYGAGGDNEILTADVLLDDKWYRINYFTTVDNKNTSNLADNTREIYLSIQRLY